MLVAAHAREVVDVTGLGQADHRVEQQVGLGDLGGALGQLLVRPVHRVAGLECDDPGPAPLLEPMPEIGGLVAQLPEIVLGRPGDAAQPAAEVDGMGAIEQMVDARMEFVDGREHRLRLAPPVRLRRCPRRS